MQGSVNAHTIHAKIGNQIINTIWTVNNSIMLRAKKTQRIGAVNLW
jgi:hypothetical protein